MSVRSMSQIRMVMVILAALVSGACGHRTSSSSLASIPPAAPLTSDPSMGEQTTRFLEAKIKRDPEDFIALNKLAAIYLQRVRETGDLNYLSLAARAAGASLTTLPVEQNIGGLIALTQVQYASHEFIASRDHAQRLAELEPNKSYSFQMLGDALLELGEYDKATAAFRRMEQLGGIQGLTRVAVEQRMARLSALHGNTEAAQRSLTNALNIAMSLPVPPKETVAWCRWQLGETAFGIGDYQTAERYYRDALVTFPDYFRALASLGRVRAAQGDLPGAIECYERATSIVPDPTFVAALGDLYKLAGRDKEAAAEYAVVEQIAHLNDVNGALYNRQQALFCADHDIKTEEAYEKAVKEYAGRRDIYGADALAWTALKTGRVAEAQTAITEALRLGTRDARLFYHAGMIASAAGNSSDAHSYLLRALSLNPEFDPLQSSIAKRTLNGGV